MSDVDILLSPVMFVVMREAAERVHSTLKGHYRIQQQHSNFIELTLTCNGVSLHLSQVCP